MSRWRLHFGPRHRRSQASGEGLTQAQEAEPVAVRQEVAPGVWLDSRLALSCPAESWLAIADIHYGYELSQQSAGWLFPDYGRGGIEARLHSLLTEYQPQTLIMAGDMVHGPAGVEAFLLWLEELRGAVERIVLVAGNHDRYLGRKLGTLTSVHMQGERYFFHHGHEERWKGSGEIEITGHWHPAITLGDGAGTRVRGPAFLREPRPMGGERWVLPAFSPWTGGTTYPRVEGDQVWLCHPRRIVRA